MGKALELALVKAMVANDFMRIIRERAMLMVMVSVISPEIRLVLVHLSMKTAMVFVMSVVVPILKTGLVCNVVVAVFD
jgi:hypothetical protein